MVNSQLYVKGLLLLQAVLFFVATHGLQASRTASRNFSNLENSTDFVVKKKGQVTSYFFMTSGSSAIQRNEDHGGCSPIELWGRYNFRDLIASRQIFDSTYVNPLAAPLPARVDQDLFFRVDSEIKTAGLMFSRDCALCDCAIKNARWSVGVSLPVISAQTFLKFLINRSTEVAPNGNGPGFTMSEADEVTLDGIRRQFHQELGLAGNTWNSVAVGDLESHIGWTYERDHWLKMRNVIIQNRLGFLVPLAGMRGNGSDRDYPSSVALNGSGHTGIFNDLFAEFELKSNWKLGVLFSGLWQSDQTRMQRISVYKEPSPFSALSAQVTVKPGFTFKFAPSFTLENIVEGVNAKVTYTYLKHGEDTWTHKRDIIDKKSYLNQDFSAIRGVITNAKPTDIIENIDTKTRLSSWMGHYLSFNIAYDSNQTLNNWKYDPVFFVSYDYPLGGLGIVNNAELRLGFKLHF